MSNKGNTPINLQFQKDNEMSDFDTELKWEGLNCPLPVLKTKKEIDGMSSGEILKMTSTDPGSVNDVSFWSKTNGNYL